MLAFCLLLSSATAFADPFADAQAAALVWIKAQQQTDGSWGSDPRLRALLTQQAVGSLEAARDRGSGYYRGVAWLENHATPGMDGHARRILALASHGDDLSRSIAVLDASSADVGVGLTGWGLSPGYQPSIFESALALEAYAAVGALDLAEAGVSYLIAHQAASGAWPVRSGLPEDRVTTAIVLRVLVQLEGQTPIDLSSARQAARSYLEASVLPSAPQLDRAHAALSLLRDTPGSASASSLVTTLVAEQDPIDGDADDGSWAGDVHVTALVSRALSALIGTDAPELATPVHVPDFALRARLNQTLQRNVGDQLTRGELLQVTTLQAASAGLSDLSGLEEATALTSVDLRYNSLTNLSVLEGLPSLGTALLYGNPGLGLACDVNASGTLEAGDATRILSLAEAGSHSLTEQAIADVAPTSGPGDGVLDTADALLVIRAAAGRPVSVCPGS